MRIAHSLRYLLAASAVLAAACAAAPTDASDGAGVVSAATDAPATGDTIAVHAMANTAPILFAPTATTAAPTAKANASTPATAAPSAATLSPATLAPSAVTLAPSATTATPASPGATTTGSGDGAASAVVIGTPITCAFRYSLPTASNLADELAASAKAAAAKKKKSDSAASNASGNASSASNATASSSSGSGAAASTTDGTATGPTAAGSGAGEPLPSAGSSDGTTGGVTVTKTPSPSTKTPVSTTATKAPVTKTPTSTSTTTVKTPAPSAGAGSSDGATTGRMLQTDAGAGEVATPTPSPSSKKPSTTTTAPVTKKPSATAEGSGAGDEKATPTPSTVTTSPSFSSSDSSGASDPSASTSTNSTATDSSSANATSVVTGEFTCDASFYGAWSTLGLTCGGVQLDVASAVSQSQCLIYSGVQSTIVDIKMCMSVCKFPKCSNGTWDYTSEDGFTSDIYTKLNFVELLTAVGKGNLLDSKASTALASLSFKTDRECSYTGEASFKTCQCENLLIDGSSSSSSSKTPTPAALSPVVDKGLADANHWGDGVPKSSIDKAGIASTAVGTSAAAVSVAAGAVMSVAGSIMGTSAGVAGGVSATASLGLAMVAVDMCQFGVMINQMNLDASPRMLQEMGKRMAPAAFSFLPFGKVEDDDSNSTSNSTVSRRLMDVTNTNQTLGMERYAALIGVKVDMLFYLTLAGVMLMCVAPFVLCAIFVVCASPFVDSFKDFSRKWFDKAVGVLMMILILSEYVVGVTATFQICYLIKYDKMDIGLALAIFALVFFAVGTILYGIWVVRRHEDELRDLGTKDHFEKPVHARYGPLYDEYKFEGRYFFAPKLLLSLMCGVTTGFIGMPGIWQVIVLITLHIAFLLYMEVKRPFPSAFVQKTSSFVIIIKISGLFLTLFLISSATSLQGDIPVDLREGVGFAIIGLQVVVLLCLMVRQVYIFYMTWKLKRQEDENKEMAQQQQSTNSFNPLGSNINSLHQGQGQSRQYHVQQYQGQDQFAILDGGHASTPLQQQYGGNSTPGQYNQQPGKLRGLQPAPLPAQGMRRTHTVVVHDDPTPNNNYRRHNNEISL